MFKKKINFKIVILSKFCNKKNKYLYKMYQELEDGSITVSYEDYNVECFGGSDYEVIYTLSKENANKLKQILEEKNGKNKDKEVSLKELIINRFGPNLKKESFSTFCDSNGIKYEFNSFVH